METSHDGRSFDQGGHTPPCWKELLECAVEGLLWVDRPIEELIDRLEGKA